MGYNWGYNIIHIMWAKHWDSCLITIIEDNTPTIHG